MSNSFSYKRLDGLDGLVIGDWEEWEEWEEWCCVERGRPMGGWRERL